MENATMTGHADAPGTYDYRLYDRIWQRVSPELDPYPEVRAARNAGDMGAGPADAPSTAPSAAQRTAGTEPSYGAGMGSAGVSASTAMSAAAGGGRSAVPALEGGGLSNLPGAEPNPCCMGTQAQESVEVVAGFIDEELAECRCCMTLSRRVCNQNAARLFRRIAGEKQAAARELRAAYYLITGSCYSPAITMERRQWDCLSNVLRSCYHQEACNGFNYQRAADESEDPCLSRLLNRLGEASYRRADEVMDLLGRVIN